ncbi:Protein MRG1 [Striga hermonthica]|uniref:Protein MRG1 n=1 Tax=Striga hermonthica TaxID=68872 RepID=A0A9N7NXZ6_STRHE|nr:Protein MRG1 [Striga hermonthica]
MPSFVLCVESWDEWVSVDRLLKYTEENVLKQDQLNNEHATERSSKPGRQSQDNTKSSVGLSGKERECDIDVKEESVAPWEKLMSIQIPSALKKQLVNDQECITHLGQLVKLPRSPSVCEILNKYSDYRVKKDGVIVETVVEIISGLRCYFDKALPAMLLYKEEREQYKQVIADNTPPSCIYGAEHFLRLFVKLPEMLSSVYIEMETFQDLQQILMDFLKFLMINRSAFFITNYQNWGGSFTAVKEEEN